MFFVAGQFPGADLTLATGFLSPMVRGKVRHLIYPIRLSPLMFAAIQGQSITVWASPSGTAWKRRRHSINRSTARQGRQDDSALHRRGTVQAQGRGRSGAVTAVDLLLTVIVLGSPSRLLSARSRAALNDCEIYGLARIALALRTWPVARWLAIVVGAFVLSYVVAAFISLVSEPLFRDIFGHGSSRAGMGLDHLLLTLIIFGSILIGLYGSAGRTKWARQRFITKHLARRAHRASAPGNT
jgi:hypothetical protein